MNLPTLSVVIPTHNGRQHLERCLAALAARRPAGSQVIVVDDASTDSTVPWILAAHPWVELVPLSPNQGFCGAVNAGLERARGDVIELLNDDTEVQPGWAEAALRHFDDPAIGSVAPLVLSMNEPDVIDSAGQTYHLCGWAQNRGIGQRLSAGYEQPCAVFGPSGSAGFYRRSALQRTGYLLPEYGAYFEDTDLAFRLRWAGYHCRFEPASRVLHLGTASYGRQPERHIRLIARNEELVFWINLPLGWLLLGLVPHLGFQAVRLIRKALSGHLAPFWAGKKEALALWRTVLRRRRELLCLARKNQGSADLGLSASPDVIRQGWTWMTKRRSA